MPTFPEAVMVQTLAAAGELQRDLQRELTYDGLRAAEAKGSKGGRRPAVPADKTDDVRIAYLKAARSPPLPASVASAAARRGGGEGGAQGGGGLQYLEPYAEAARTWLHAEAEVVDTTHLTPAQAAQQIAEAVKS
ncbi:hypothetical protein [Streptomyces sp. NPDC090994]|uniref:hypothetical protein n=1 Tax=Streptomyces sp. NPDC090994 TaxID=3365969 RepID=UPI00382C9CB0